VRLAWFSPWPPQASGVAGRSAELVPELAARGLAIDVFVDHEQVSVDRLPSSDPTAPGSHRVHSAHDFIWRMRLGQYDLTVYQVGNSRCHEYIWPYLYRWPGLTVLHDARLHHARGRARLRHRQFDDYRAEVHWNHPDTPPGVAELGVAGFDGNYYYLWPMLRAVVESSRVVATHARGAIEEIRRSAPESATPIEYIALGEGQRGLASEAVREMTRSRLGCGATDVVYGVFGGLHADKRIDVIFRSVARLRRRMPQVKLLVAGGAGPSFDLNRAVERSGIADAVIIIPAPDDESFDRLIEAVDVSLNLRWPSALETSGPWLRALAAGRATITIALAHQSHVPAWDPRTWLPWPGSPTEAPITVALDILDEEHSLGLALSRLAEDQRFRGALGVAARQYWEREHTVPRMADDYQRVLKLAAGAPAPPRVALPDALRPDPLRSTRDLLRPFGVTSCEFC
jgi:glycosyltransferase involved in cell wall biosynthesis